MNGGCGFTFGGGGGWCRFLDLLYGCPGLTSLSKFEAKIFEGVNAHDVAPRVNHEESCWCMPTSDVHLNTQFSQSSYFTSIEITQGAGAVSSR